MDLNLSIHIEANYLTAAIEPLSGKFEMIIRRGVSEFYFYFNIDNIGQRIDYGHAYKAKFGGQAMDASNSRTINNFLQLIEKDNETYSWYGYENKIINLLLLILNDVRKAYVYIFRNKYKKTDLLENSEIPVSLSFNDSISAKSRTLISNFFEKNNFKIDSAKRDMAELVATFHTGKERKMAQGAKIAVIEALGNDLNMSVVNYYTPYDRERSVFKTFASYGADPRATIIARKIVDDINKQTGLLKNEKECQAEYSNHLPIAYQLLEQIDKSKSPYLNVQTTFKKAPSTTLSTTISVEEIAQLATFHVRQLSLFFEENCLKDNQLRPEDIDSIIIAGNTLNNNIIKNEFSRFDNQKIFYLSDDEAVKYILAAHLFKGNYANQNTVNDYEKVDYLTIEQLKISQKIKLSNFDPTPGKGESVQLFIYIGDNKFEVIESSRSLQKGDIAHSVNTVWANGLQLDFDIERGGRKLGRFRTRIVVTIEVN